MAEHDLGSTDRHIYHLALADEWSEAVRRGEPYRRSTIGKALDEVGFIHCSFAEQVRPTAHRLYRDRTDVIVLTIDTALVASPIRIENLSGGTDCFPHIYGPLPLDAVQAEVLESNPQ